MTASYEYAAKIIIRAHRATKLALLEHIEKDTEAYEQQDELLSNLQSLRAAQTLIANGLKNPIVQHINSATAQSLEELEHKLETELASDLGQPAPEQPAVPAGKEAIPKFLRTQAGEGARTN